MSLRLIEKVNAIAWERDPEYSRQYPARNQGWCTHDTLEVWLKTLSPEERKDLVQEIAILLQKEIVDKGITRFDNDYGNPMNFNAFIHYTSILGREKFNDPKLVVAMCERFWAQNKRVEMIGYLTNSDDKVFAEKYILEMMERVYEYLRSGNGDYNLLFDMIAMGEDLLEILGAKVLVHFDRFIRFDKFKMVIYGIAGTIILSLLRDERLKQEACEEFKVAKSQLTEEDMAFIDNLFQIPHFLSLLGEDALRCLGEEKRIESMKAYEREREEYFNQSIERQRKDL